ncbi:MAG: hypothetical protein HFJ10_07320 [Lachnospiraceae bacterium]|jgi:hypothetical protein|nr:hypothetical protein [Lachnospiraceae bacterium]
MNKLKISLLTLSFILGIAGTYTFAPYSYKPNPARYERVSWWSGLYPEYCIPDATHLVEGDQSYDSQEEIPVKIRFKYLTFLNEAEG